MKSPLIVLHGAQCRPPASNVGSALGGPVLILPGVTVARVSQEPRFRKAGVYRGFPDNMKMIVNGNVEHSTGSDQLISDNTIVCARRSVTRWMVLHG